MNRYLKVGLIASLIAGGYYLIVTGKKTVSQWAKNISIKFLAIGKPEIKSGALILPVQLAITNPTPVAIPVDNITGKIFFFKSGLWQPVGEIKPSGPIQFESGTSTKVFYPTLDLAKLNPFTSAGNILQIATGLISNGGNYLQTMKIEITATFKGYSYTNSFEQVLNINELIRAAA